LLSFFPKGSSSESLGDPVEKVTKSALARLVVEKTVLILELAIIAIDDDAGEHRGAVNW
jgi:hypothetical protein